MKSERSSGGGDRALFSQSTRSPAPIPAHSRDFRNNGISGDFPRSDPANALHIPAEFVLLHNREPIARSRGTVPERFPRAEKLRHNRGLAGKGFDYSITKTSR